MKRFNGTEIAALALASVLFVGGAGMVIWPPAGVVPHENKNPYGGNGSGLVTMNAAGSRVCGIAGMLLGAGMIAITLGEKK